MDEKLLITIGRILVGKTKELKRQCHFVYH